MRGPPRNSRRRPRNSSLKWFSLVVATAVVRLVWKSIVFTAYFENSTRDLDFQAILSIPTNPVLRRSNPRRSRKKRPSQISNSDLESPLDVVDFRSTSRTKIQTVPPKGLEEFSDEPAYWKFLCGDGESALDFSSKSRVLISGVLSHSVASELALALSTRCGVKTIYGLSDHTPTELDVTTRLAHILQKLPDFKFFGQSAPFSLERLETIFAQAKPTHVILFEPATFLPSSFREHTTMSTRGSLEHLDRLCSSLVRLQRNEARKPIRFAYVTSPLPMESDPMEAHGLHTTYPLLLSTFRTRHKLDGIHINLENIFGPFPESSVLSSDIEDMLKGSSSLLETSDKHVHISEALVILVSGLRSTATKTSRLPSFEGVTDSQVTLGEVLSSFDSDASKGRTKTVNDWSRLMLSWFHQSTFPFDDVTRVHANQTTSVFRKAMALANRRLEGNKESGISVLQRRRSGTLPCNSECVANSPCIETTTYSDIIPLSQNITNDCRFVMFTSDFSRQLDNLPDLSVNSNDNYPRELLCQVAFVSGKSKLVKQSLEKQKGKKSKEINGKLIHNGWRLIWLEDHDDTTMSEADFMHIKIAPGPFFAHNVTKGFYFEPKHIKKLPPLQVVWFLMSKHMDAKRQKSVSKYIKKPKAGWIETPVVPARRVTLFGHTYGISPDMVQRSDMESIGKFILRQKNTTKGSGEWPERQMEFYDYVKDYYSFVLVDTFLVIHNLEATRSKRIRCEWYEEHLFWAQDGEKRNRHLEDLSLAYVMAKWRNDKMLVGDGGSLEDEWGERIVDAARGDIMDISGDSAFHPSQFFVRLHPPLSARRMYPDPDISDRSEL